jgi:hypothetical protein
MGMGQMQGLRLFTAICIFSSALVAADSPFAGTWKLDPAKSKNLPGTGDKEAMVVFEAVGDQWKRVATGVDPDGKPYKYEDTIAWDGKDHAIQLTGMTVAVNTLNDHALKFTLKSEGKITMTGRLVVSKDGKTSTAYSKGKDDKGRKVDSVEVFEKQ